MKKTILFFLLIIILGQNDIILAFDFTNWPLSIAIDDNDKKWIGTYHEGVVCIEDGVWTSYTKESDGLGDNVVWSIAVDLKGVIWCGTRSRAGGEQWTDYICISCFDGEKWTQFYRFDEEWDTFDEVHSIAVDNNNVKWFGTKQGVTRYDDNTWSRFTTSDGLPDNYIYSLAVDKNNLVWAFTGGNICSFDGEKWSKYPNEKTGIKSTCYCIAVDNLNNKWFGVEEGVIKFENNTWTKYADTIPGYNDLDDPGVEVIVFNNDNDIWCFSDGGEGIYSFDGTTWKSHKNPFEGEINDAAVDHNNKIWCTGLFGIGTIESDSQTSIVADNYIPFYSLKTAYPNPFNPTTTIEYNIPQDSHVILTIYNVSGQRISVLKDEMHTAGNYSITWNAEGLPSGLYFYTLKAKGYSETRKMVLMK